MHAGQRDLDVVIYGATGFAGKLTARYLARADPDLRVGLAGRSLQRLHTTRRALGDTAQDWPVLVASNPTELKALAAKTRVVISTVGPYSAHGLPVIGACAAAGTDYLDLAGEVPFVRRSIDLHHKQALDTGARIVHSCGFDSIPSDLTVYALHRRAAEDGVGELGDTTFVLRTTGYSEGYSRGTIQTMLELIRAGSSDPQTRQLLDDPYSLSPNRIAEPDLGSQPDLEMRRGIEIAPELAGIWTGGYLMGLYNTRCVRRTNALLNWPYGERFRYRETMSMGTSAAAPAIAAMANATITGMSRFGAGYLRMLPPGLVESFTPPAGVGYSDESRGHYRIETYTTTSGGARYVGAMAQQGDPGYAATSVLLGESALILATARDTLSERRGVLTPVAAMGDALLARLPSAGVTIGVDRLS